MEATTESFVEYDLDEEDEEWLAKYNDGQERLSGEKLEFMIMKLEHICAEITDKAFVAAGASAAERNSAAASASTSHLSREDALAALKCANMRQAVKCCRVRVLGGKEKAEGKAFDAKISASSPRDGCKPIYRFPCKGENSASTNTTQA